MADVDVLAGGIEAGMAELVEIARRPARHTSPGKPVRATTNGNANGRKQPAPARRKPRAAAKS